MKLFIVIMILVIYVVCKKNSFNSLQKSIKHGESEIGIQIAKRRDCLDDALRIAKLSYRDITAARQILNGNIREYNTAITSFPGSLLASVFGYQEEKFLDEENGAQNRQMNKSEIDFNQY